MSLERIFSESGTIEYLEFDADYIAHMEERGTYSKHVVSNKEILEVLEGKPQFYPNAAGQRAPVVMIGPTGAGRMLFVPVEPTGKWEVWRPVTAYTANTSHVERYKEDTKDAK